MHPKLSAAAGGMGAGGAASQILLWLLSLKGISVPGNVGDAIGTLLDITFGLAAGYFTPSPK